MLLIIRTGVQGVQV